MSSVLSIYARPAMQPVSAPNPVSKLMASKANELSSKTQISANVDLSAQTTKAIENAKGQNKVVSATQAMSNVSTEAKNILGKMNELAKNVASSGGSASKEVNSELQDLNKQLNEVFKSNPELFHNSAKGEQETSKSYKTGENSSVEVKSQDVSGIAKDLGTISNAEDAQKFMKNVESSFNNLKKVDNYTETKVNELEVKSSNTAQSSMNGQPKIPNLNDIDRTSSKIEMKMDSLMAKYTGSSSSFDLKAVNFSQYV